MANLREATAVSMDATNLGGRMDGGESHADRIGALAMSDRLAALLWHLKYNNDRKSFKPAWMLLSSRVHARAKFKRWHGAGKDVIDRMCQQVVKEWLADFCMECKGSGIIGGSVTNTNTQRKVCQICTGEGFLITGGKKSPLEYDAPFSHLAPQQGYCNLSGGEVRHKCRACSGMGYTLYEPKHRVGKLSACPSCKGQPRIRKPSLQDRVLAIGITSDAYRLWEKRFDQAMDMILVADRKCNVTMNIQLERLENG